MSIIISIALGITLSAACGFRVFIPPLALSLAANFGHIHLAPGLHWVGTYPALIVFSTAAIVEALTFCIPGLSHLLDIVAAPIALSAGTLLTAATLDDVNPVFRWTIAIVAGGGSTGIVQGMTSMTRLATGALTGSLASPIVAAMEALSAIILSILALVIPLLAFIIVLIILWWSLKKVKRFINSRKRRAPVTE
jgi:Domain of unknown function (DUF4126)